MKTLIFTLALFASFTSFAQDEGYSDATRDTLNSTLPGGENQPGSLDAQTLSPTVQKALTCLNKIDEVLTQNHIEIRTDYNSSPGDHFIFRQQQQSILHLSAKGVYECSLKFPVRDDLGRSKLQVIIDGRLVQPYGNTGEPAVEARNCTPVAMDAAEAYKFTNQATANLKYFGAGMRAKGKSRTEAKNAIRDACQNFENFSNHVENGFTKSSELMNKGVYLF